EGKGSLHVFEDHFYPEIVDPETGDPVPEGEQGELVLTSLSKEAQPVIRYRTRDITRFNPEPCACGRTLRRIDRLAGRADDMLIIRGINVYPTTIESVILEDPALGGHFYLIVDKRGTLPELHARVEVREEADLALADTIAERLQAKLMEVIRLRVNIEVFGPGALPRNELGKTKRVWEQTTDEDPLG
ncbi:MAG: phenylacetate--CoA ligase, partial [Acidimicrobiia bacterium]